MKEISLQATFNSRSSDLKRDIICGGNCAGYSVCDKGVIIDFKEFQQI